jgi:hypothetical protein
MDHGNNLQLTRTQIERIAMVVALNKNISKIDIKQSSSSGIGLGHELVVHYNDGTSLTQDITDIEVW